MSGRSLRALALLGGCLAVLLGGVGWISVTALRLERAEAAARRQAAVEENVRLALWRMDSDVMPILAREAARPYFLPSSYTLELPERVLLHFQFEADGRLTSPQMWPDNPPEELRERFARLERLVTRAQLAAALPAAVAFTASLDTVDGTVERQRVEAPQQYRNSVEWKARAKSVRQASTNSMGAYDQNAQNAQETADLPPGAEGRAAPADEPMVPVWVGGELLLARRIWVDDGEVLQGCWLDWPAVRDWLLADVRELLPEARLEPMPAPARLDAERMLASLPVRLLPGTVAVAAATPGGAPVRTILGVAWSGVLLAAVAAMALLLGALALGERRAAFVSAVTHELRTPLTTLRTYSEMLAEGMVKDEGKRQRYLATLQREADRLAHLVENVLSYARVERGRGAARAAETLEVAALFERVRPRLEDRAAQAEMTLVVEPTPEALALRGDPTAIEQILFNLVDNACKYAASAEDRRIELRAAATGDTVTLRVADHGPGVPDDVRRRLFHPFRRSAREAAGSAPGVGLGLALSRRLARAMSGDLRLVAASTFELTLRSAARS